MPSFVESGRIGGGACCFRAQVSTHGAFVFLAGPSYDVDAPSRERPTKCGLKGLEHNVSLTRGNSPEAVQQKSSTGVRISATRNGMFHRQPWKITPLSVTNQLICRPGLQLWLHRDEKL